MRYHFFIVCCRGTTCIAHNMAIESMIQDGSVQIASLSFLLELQRDWTLLEPYEADTRLAMEDAGTYSAVVVLPRIGRFVIVCIEQLF